MMTAMGMTVFVVGAFISWRWDMLKSRVKKLEHQTQVLKSWNIMSDRDRLCLYKKLKTLEASMQSVRGLQVKQRERTPAERPTLRNRELMKLGRDIQTGAVDKEITRITDDD